MFEDTEAVTGTALFLDVSMQLFIEMSLMLDYLN